jgi:hypothetical protein
MMGSSMCGHLPPMGFYATVYNRAEIITICFRAVLVQAVAAHTAHKRRPFVACPSPIRAGLRSIYKTARLPNKNPRSA